MFILLCEGSPPVWGCGLKQPLCHPCRLCRCVTPRVGVWIETKQAGFITSAIGDSSIQSQFVDTGGLVENLCGTDDIETNNRSVSFNIVCLILNSEIVECGFILVLCGQTGVNKIAIDVSPLTQSSVIEQL